MDRRSQARKRAALQRNVEKAGADLKTLPCGCRQFVLTERNHVPPSGFHKQPLGQWACRVWRVCKQHWEEMLAEDARVREERRRNDEPAP
jgi:hypothetical protein